MKTKSTPKVQKKIKKLISEGYQAEQAAAIAYNMQKKGKL